MVEFAQKITIRIDFLTTKRLFAKLQTVFLLSVMFYVKIDKTTVAYTLLRIVVFGLLRLVLLVLGYGNRYVVNQCARQHC